MELQSEIIQEQLKPSLGRRLASMFVDHFLNVIAIGVIAIIGVTVYMVIGGNTSEEAFSTDTVGVFALLLLSLYFNKDIFQGRSIAKRVLRFQVIVKRTGLPAKSVRCFIRNITIIIWPIEVLVIAISPSRRIGDFIAGTKVVLFDSKQISNVKASQMLLAVILSFSYTLLIALVFVTATGLDESDGAFADYSKRDQIFKTVVDDRLKLDGKGTILPDSGDTIVVSNLTLIENSYRNYFFNKEKNLLGIFSLNAPELSDTFFLNSLDLVLEQISVMSPGSWSPKSIQSDIIVESPNSLASEEAVNRVVSWIESNRYTKSYLQISEPIFNKKGEVLVGAKITAGRYEIDKWYLMTPAENSWKIVKSQTLVGKVMVPTTEDVRDSNGNVGTKTTHYTTVLGYYDI